MAMYSPPAFGGSDPVPDMVQQFIVFLYRHIRERNIREIFSMYDVTFAKMSERFFKGSSWPPVEMVAHLVDNDHVFCLLYKEMFFRHLYATAQPSLEQRAASFDNYAALFKIILESNVNMQLPNGWLWDMIDEYIYQFQSFAQYRGKLAQRTPHELEQLRQMPGVWDIGAVLRTLQALVDRSNVAAELGRREDAQRRFAETEGYEQHGSNVLRTLGYFSLLGLLRMHTLLGDYEAALQALAGVIHPFRTALSLTPKIAGAHISLYYYAGFAYLMQRRWLDAARAFNIVLTYIARVKQYHQRSAGYDQILKKNEQMFALLAVTVAMCPAAEQHADESVSNLLREKYGEKIQRMQRGEQGAYEELFIYACPKFTLAQPPSLEAPAVNTNQEAFRQQLRTFLAFVDQTRHLPALKQFLKLYTSISLAKLAGLMDMDTATLRGQLQVLKMTSACKTWAGKGDALDGEVQSCADVEFKLSSSASGEEMITMVDVRQPRSRGSEVLIRHIARFQEIVKDLDGPPAEAAAQRVAVH